MSEESDHESVQADLAAAAFGALDPADYERVVRHLAQCARCREEMAGLAETVAMLSLRVPVRTMDPAQSRAMRDRLVGRAAAERLPAPSAPTARTWGSRVVGHPVTGWAVAAGLASLLLTHHGFHRPLNFGWIVAGALAAILTATGAHSIRQRAEIERLRRQLGAGGESIRSEK